MNISITIEDIKNVIGSSFDPEIHNEEFKKGIEESLNESYHIDKLIKKEISNYTYYRMSVNTVDKVKKL